MARGIQVGVAVCLLAAGMLTACKQKPGSTDVKGLEFGGDRQSCENSTRLWMENYKTFEPQLIQAAECMDRLKAVVGAEIRQTDLEKTRHPGPVLDGTPAGARPVTGDPSRSDRPGGESSPGLSLNGNGMPADGDVPDTLAFRKACIAEISALTPTIKPMAGQGGTTLLELQAKLLKCLGQRSTDERQLVQWLLDTNRLLKTEKWITESALFPIVPFIGRGPQVFSELRPKDGEPDHARKMEFYGLCVRNSDSVFNQYTRMDKARSSFENEFCNDPDKHKDRNVKAVAFWMCDSPCKYSGIPCQRCTVQGNVAFSQTCSTEIAARHSIQNWCKDTFLKECPAAQCAPVTEADVILGREIGPDGRATVEGPTQTGGAHCEVSTEGEATEISGRMGGQVKVSAGGGFKLFGFGAKASMSEGVRYVKSGSFTGTVTSAFTICSEGYDPWIKRKDGRLEADHTAYYSCTANLDTVNVSSSELDVELSANLSVEAPVLQVEGGVFAGGNEKARQFKGLSIAWASGMKSAGGASPEVLRATCQRAVENWKTNSMQNWLDNHPTVWTGRMVGGVDKGFCTDDSDCKSINYSSTSKWAGKVWRCLRDKETGTGKCNLLATGRVNSGNKYCGNRCQRDGWGAYDPCDRKGGFTCRTTTVPYAGWHWAWQDADKLTETVDQCVPDSWANGPFEARRYCKPLPGIDGD